MVTTLCLCSFCAPHASAQDVLIGQPLKPQPALPDAPIPQIAPQIAAADIPGNEAQQPAQTQTPQPAPTQPPQPGQTPTQQPAPSQSSSSPQTPTAPETDAQRSQREKADEQLKEQEKQRVLGVVPNFNISYRSDAVSLTAKQKVSLALHSATDPVTFGVAILVAGYHEALDDDTGFGWGAEGFGKRAGAAYLDAFDGTMIGNGILPAIFRQDPRYFRLGHGTTRHRLLYAMATTVICKQDKSRRWVPNYSNVGGNIIAGAISNWYYPSQNSGWGQTITDGLTVTAEGTIGGVFDEFWPDISRKLFHKDPTHGLDAQARAADAAAKQARQASQQKQPVDSQK